MKNIFVTGGTGGIGMPLVQRLSSKGYNITVLTRTKGLVLPGNNVRYVMGDLLEPASYGRHLDGIDTVVHMAGLTHSNDAGSYYRINHRATADLLDACTAHGIKRFIFISTRAIAKEGGDYSRSKLMAEECVRRSDRDWVIIRLSEVYGLNATNGVDMLLAAIDKYPVIPVVGDGKYRLNPVHISDVVFAIAGIIDDAGLNKKIYNIAGPGSLTYNQVVLDILKIKKVKRALLHVPIGILKASLALFGLFSKNAFITTDQLPRLLSSKDDDISLAAGDLGFKPKKMEEALSC